MFTVDIVALMDRINRLEQETKELRELAKTNYDELSNDIEAARQYATDLMPTITEDGKLKIETYDEAGNTVYGHVIAEIKSDERPEV